MALRMAGMLILLALVLGTAPPGGQSSPAAALSAVLADPRMACTSFCLDNGDHCVFGANQDNPIDAAMLAVKRRQVLKTAWEPSTTGEYARWISRYGSVTFDYGCLGATDPALPGLCRLANGKRRTGILGQASGLDRGSRSVWAAGPTGLPCCPA